MKNNILLEIIMKNSHLSDGVGARGHVLLRVGQGCDLVLHLRESIRNKHYYMRNIYSGKHNRIHKLRDFKKSEKYNS